MWRGFSDPQAFEQRHVSVEAAVLACLTNRLGLTLAV
jgi:hypothetical protein